MIPHTFVDGFLRPDHHPFVRVVLSRLPDRDYGWWSVYLLWAVETDVASSVDGNAECSL